ncbi:MAG: ATP-binding protein [Nitrospirota bacterium]
MFERQKITDGLPGDISSSAILHSLPDAVFITDPQMRINYFNFAAEKITEFRSFEADGMYCKDVLKSGICETECVVKKALDADQNIFNIETTIKTATGRTIPALVSASLIKDLSGKLVGYLYSFRDISLFKKIMSDLEISRARLAERNEELDKAIEELKLTHEKLLQAQKMEALGTLAGGIAHDFNNILTGILGFASLAGSELSSENPLHRYIDYIEKSASRAAGLTNKILTFARRGLFELKTVDVNKIVTEVFQILERTTDRNIIIHCSLSAQSCCALIDSSKMEQALMNICVNAVEAMPEGGSLTIKTECLSVDSDRTTTTSNVIRPGDYVRISVVDTGVGMDAGTLKKIFDPFFTTKGKSGGTGLGLAMVYGVINDFGGNIEVESSPGRGTTFSLYIPLSSSTVQAGTPENIVDISELPRGKGETILLVDDEKIIRELGRNMLKHLGYNVILAPEGGAAIELYKKCRNEIALVILDLIMPHVSGREVFDRLRQINPDVKIIVSTGYAKNELLQPLLAERATGFLEKPYKINAMAESIRNAIGRNSEKAEDIYGAEGGI